MTTVIWIKTPHWGWICVPPKSSASSFYAALAAEYDVKVYTNERPLRQLNETPGFKVARLREGEGYEGTFIVRHPVDRFLSAWRDKCASTRPANVVKNHGSWKQEVAGLPLDEFFEYAKKNDNQHWCHVHKHFCGGQLVPFERVKDWWNSVAKTPYPHINQTTLGRAQPIDSGLHRDICLWFDQDIMLYERAHHEYAKVNP